MINVIQPGLYRHFKGNFYMVMNIAKDCSDNDKIKVYYYNAIHPEYGMFIRDMDEWFTDVSERDDNYMMQATRFIKIEVPDFTPPQRTVPEDPEDKNKNKEVEFQIRRFYNADYSPIRTFKHLQDAFNFTKNMKRTKIYKVTYEELPLI